MKQFLAILYLYLLHFCTSSTIIKLEKGDISGTTYELPNGRIIHAFYGVPYAAPPIRELRFKEPQMVKPWSGVWNASTMSSPCLQFDQLFLESMIGEEDCLFVNVFTPKLSENSQNPLLDVLFFIHGGALMYGSANMAFPDYIMLNSDIVCVLVNYRLGPLGFFSTGDEVVPGNNGLKDQSAALKWVHDNIIKFGGNPDSVTIAGCSAGAASVQYHYLSPLSDGLFHRGISFSGSVLNEWAYTRNNTEKSMHLAALLGCPTTTTRDAVDCLRQRPGKQITEAVEFFQPWKHNPGTPLGPTIEPATPRAFLTEEPIQLLSKGLVKNLPWLITLNRDEGLVPAADFMAQDNILQQLESNWQDIAPHLFGYNYSTSSDEERDLVSQAIKKYYFNDEPISKQTSSNLIKVLGDRHFFNGIIRAASLQSAVSKENVFCFMFNYRGKYSLTNLFAHDLEDYGISHADDLMYVLQYTKSSSLETESDYAMVEYMASIITRFMKTGNPNSGKPEWKPLSKSIDNKISCLFINSSSEQSMGEVDRVEEIEFWKNILPVEHHIRTDPPIKNEL